MKEFAREFYNSKAWREVRLYIFQRDHGLCVKCPKVGEVVHHIIPVTPENLLDPEISLGENNLELLCRDCHAAAHSTSLPIDDTLAFDEHGNLYVKRLFEFS